MNYFDRQVVFLGLFDCYGRSEAEPIPKNEAMRGLLYHSCVPDGAGGSAVCFPIGNKQGYGDVVFLGVFFGHGVGSGRAAGNYGDRSRHVPEEKIALSLKLIVIFEVPGSGN